MKRTIVGLLLLIGMGAGTMLLTMAGVTVATSGMTMPGSRRIDGRFAVTATMETIARRGMNAENSAATIAT